MAAFLGSPTIIATSIDSGIALLPASERGTDSLLRDAVIQGLRRSGYRALSDVTCDVTDGVVSLSGVVPTFFMKQIAQTIILRMGTVERLANQLEVQSSYCESSLSESHQEYDG